MNEREKQGPQGERAAPGREGKQVNQDDHVSERGKNFRNPRKMARGSKKQEINEHPVERDRVWNKGNGVLINM